MRLDGFDQLERDALVEQLRRRNAEIAALREQLANVRRAEVSLLEMLADKDAKLAAVTKERDEAQGWVTRKSDDCRELRDRLAESRATNELLTELNGKLQKRAGLWKRLATRLFARMKFHRGAARSWLDTAQHRADERDEIYAELRALKERT